MKVDQTALKFNQASIITLLVLAFLLDAPWLVALVAAVMGIGTLWPEAGLFKQIYARALKPAGLLKAHVIDDDPAAASLCAGAGRDFPGAERGGAVAGAARRRLDAGRHRDCAGRDQSVPGLLPGLLSSTTSLAAPASSPALPSWRKSNDLQGVIGRLEIGDLRYG